MGALVCYDRRLDCGRDMRWYMAPMGMVCLCVLVVLSSVKTGVGQHFREDDPIRQSEAVSTPLVLGLMVLVVDTPLHLQLSNKERFSAICANPL